MIRHNQLLSTTTYVEYSSEHVYRLIHGWYDGIATCHIGGFSPAAVIARNWETM